jgi:regulatory associated protein of mTOR
MTAIVSDGGSSQTFIASFGDGVVKVFDRRLEEEDAVVRSYSDHTSWVQNVRWHPKLSGQFLSARQVSNLIPHTDFSYVLQLGWPSQVI